MSAREPVADRPPRSRLRRVASWTARGVGRLAWGGIKAVGRVLWWSAKKGFQAGRSYERRRALRKRAPPTALDEERR